MAASTAAPLMAAVAHLTHTSSSSTAASSRTTASSSSAHLLQEAMRRGLQVASRGHSSRQHHPSSSSRLLQTCWHARWLPRQMCQVVRGSRVLPHLQPRPHRLTVWMTAMPRCQQARRSA